MATINFNDAKIFVDGFNLSGDFTDINVEHGAEMLDATVFGDSTRIRKGGLTVSSVSGNGFYDDDKNDVVDALYTIVGTDDKIITVFADGITEGTSTDKGFAMKGVVENFNFGETVGALLTFDFSMQGRGIS